MMILSIYYYSEYTKKVWFALQIIKKKIFHNDKTDNLLITMIRQFSPVEGGPATSGSLKPSQRGSTPRPFAIVISVSKWVSNSRIRRFSI